MSSLFCFQSFAADIYHGNGIEFPAKFMFPALYGGDLKQAEQYDAMFVLEAPSPGYTARKWKPCYKSEDAISVHRKIFRQWAKSAQATWSDCAQPSVQDSSLSRFISPAIRAITRRASPRNRAASRAPASRAPCFHGATRHLASPSAVLGPVEAPPCL